MIFQRDKTLELDIIQSITTESIDAGEHVINPKGRRLILTIIREDPHQMEQDSERTVASEQDNESQVPSISITSKFHDDSSNVDNVDGDGSDSIILIVTSRRRKETNKQKEK